MIPKRVKVKPSVHPVGGIQDKIRGCCLFILKQRMIKILQTQGFSSLVFVFQRRLCLPVHPAWNVAQKVDVVWSYQRASRMFLSSPEIQNASYFIESSGVNPIHNSLEYIMFNPFREHWLRWVACYIIITFTLCFSCSLPILRSLFTYTSETVEMNVDFCLVFSLIYSNLIWQCII